MNRNTKTLAASALAISLGLFTGLTANAGDWRDLVNAGLGNRTTTRTTAAQMQTAANLDTQRTAISARINSAESSGRISTTQAADFREQLGENSRMQRRFMRDGTLSFADAQSLLNTLNGIDTQLTSAIGLAGGPGLRRGGPSGDGFRRGGPSSEEIDRLQARISSRLERGRSDGRLTNDDYRSMKRDLDSINERESRMSSFNGSLSFDQRQRLLDRLSSLDNRLRSIMHDRQNAGNYRPMY